VCVCVCVYKSRDSKRGQQKRRNEGEKRPKGYDRKRGQKRPHVFSSFFFFRKRKKDLSFLALSLYMYVYMYVYIYCEINEDNRDLTRTKKTKETSCVFGSLLGPFVYVCVCV
jgi:hypothetical protein